MGANPEKVCVPRIICLICVAVRIGKVEPSAALNAEVSLPGVVVASRGLDVHDVMPAERTVQI